MSAQSTSYTGALGTIRAHDQAAIDQFLMYAEQERQRLEANVLEAEMRCREADAQLAQVTLENKRVAEELSDVWRQLQAERDRAEQMVSQRLNQVNAEAAEMASWTEQRPGGSTLPAGLNRPTSYGPRTWASPLGGSAPMVTPIVTVTPTPPAFEAFEADLDDGPPVADSFSSERADAFFQTRRLEEDVPAWEPRTEPVPIIDREPRAQYDDVPYARMATAPAGPDDGYPVDETYPDFWQLEQAAATLRAGQLEGTLTALLPMMALVIVLVVVLAWIG